MANRLHEILYEDKLSVCGLLSSEGKRGWFNLIQVFQMVNGVKSLPVDLFLHSCIPFIQQEKIERKYSNLELY